MSNWLDEAMQDYTIFKAKYAEAVRAGLLTESDVWRRFLCSDIMLDSIRVK